MSIGPIRPVLRCRPSDRFEFAGSAVSPWLTFGDNAHVVSEAATELLMVVRMEPQLVIRHQINVRRCLQQASDAPVGLDSHRQRLQRLYACSMISEVANDEEAAA